MGQRPESLKKRHGKGDRTKGRVGALPRKRAKLTARGSSKKKEPQS